MLLAVVLALASEFDTAVVADATPTKDLIALVTACNQRFRCTADIADARADAARLGLTCAPGDAACWQRFLVAEGFARVVIVHGTAPEQRVDVVEIERPTQSGRAATLALAFDAALSMPSGQRAIAADAPTPTPPTPTPTPTPTPPPPTTTSTSTTTPAPAPRTASPPLPSPLPSSVQSTSPSTRPAEDGSGLPWIVTATAGGVAVAAAVGALVVSADLSRSLDDAQAGRAPLEDYGVRSATVFTLGGVALIAGVVAVGAPFVLE